jgi:hypothetical protein
MSNTDYTACRWQVIERPEKVLIVPEGAIAPTILMIPRWQRDMEAASRIAAKVVQDHNRGIEG